MKKLLTKVDILSAVLCLCSMIPGAVIYSKLPDRIPSRFNIDFEPEEFVSKAEFVFGLPVIIAVCDIISCVLTNIITRKNSSDRPNEIVRFINPVSAFFAEVVTILYLIGRIKHIGTCLCVVVSLTYIISGNYLPKMRRNFLIGIKTPHTLKNETVWKNTHRFAGAVWIVSGIVMLPFALLGKFVPFIVVLLTANVLPFVYSEFEYHSIKKQSSETAESAAVLQNEI